MSDFKIEKKGDFNYEVVDSKTNEIKEKDPIEMTEQERLAKKAEEEEISGFETVVMKLLKEGIIQEIKSSGYDEEDKILYKLRVNNEWHENLTPKAAKDLLIKIEQENNKNK